MRDVKKIVSMLTLEEKAGLCSGLDFWNTKAVERLGIPSIMMTDGPHGLRKQAGNSDHVGLNDSVPATCFPSGAGLACSWDRKLLEKVGNALGDECQAENVSIILGPAANIKRSPLCGRNFEYFSEDPYLSSQMAAGYINGVQDRGVGTSMKHYAANNQETRRMSVDTIADERTLREIYLASFEGAVREAQPWTVMCSYNRVNGVYASENKHLLTDILKNEWGHEGFVVSDWGAVNDRDRGLAAGLELEMPSSGGLGDGKIIEAVKNGSLRESLLDSAVERLLSIIFKAVDNKKENASYNRNDHHQLARIVARECMVLLKNEGGILPLKKEGTIAVIGAFAKFPRYQGGGSSHIKPTKLDDIYEEIKKAAGSKANVIYADGYKLENDDIDEAMIARARETAVKSGVALIFAGLPDRYESEGYDRQHIRLPENHRQLIDAVVQVQPNTIVVLSNGSPVEMPWIDKVKGVLEAYLGGQALGGAIADLLFGDANPCGKLAETFPAELTHNPSYLNFPGEGDRVDYREGIFVGYRYYDAKKIMPLFPFGHGLSYTSFEYSGLTVDKKEISDTDEVNISVKVRNTGKTAGKEIVQLYVKDMESSVIRPQKELKGFEKVELAPGEEKTVCFTLGKRAFAYYSVQIKDWHVESGDFEIQVGKSSRDIVLKETLKVKSTAAIRKTYNKNSTIGDLLADPATAETARILIKPMFGEGGALGELGEDNHDLAMAMMRFMPLRTMVLFGQGKFTESMLEGVLKTLNGN